MSQTSLHETIAAPPTLDAVQVAQFLQQHPDFFQTHAAVFANLRVPHPHAPSTISLGERQVMTLREKARGLEQTLAQLMHHATGNERITDRLLQWCMQMLRQNDAQHLPHTLVTGLQEVFELPAVILKLWGLPALANSPYALGTEPIDVPGKANMLSVPYCGTLQDAGDEQWVTWLTDCFETPPASLAVIALRVPQEGPHGGQTQGKAQEEATDPFGLLLLGSSDAQRFSADMQTTFLTSLARLGSAALSRLR